MAATAMPPLSQPLRTGSSTEPASTPNTSAPPAEEFPRKPRKAATPSPALPAPWQLLLDGEAKSNLANRAQSLHAAPTQQTAKLTAGELKDRAKLAAKKAKNTSEDHSMSRWVANVAPPLIAVRPEHAAVFDAEDCVLASMRSRRNATFWPWLIAAGLRPAEVPAIDSADVPPQVRATCGEAFLRLATLAPATCDPVTGAAPSSLSEQLATSFFANVCHALFPGSGGIARAFAAEEWEVTGYTNAALQAACAARGETGPDGTSKLRPFPVVKQSRKAPEAPPVSAMTFPSFCALLRALIEPLLHTGGGSTQPSSSSAAHHTSAGAGLLAVLERIVMPAAMADDAMRRYMGRPDGSANGSVRSGGSFVRRPISITSANSRTYDAPPTNGASATHHLNLRGVGAGAGRAQSEQPSREHAANANSILPLIARGGGALSVPPSVQTSMSIGGGVSGSFGLSEPQPKSDKSRATATAGPLMSTTIAAAQGRSKQSTKLPPIAPPTAAVAA